MEEARNPGNRKRARSAITTTRSGPQRVPGGVPDLMHHSTGATVRSVVGGELTHHKLLAARYEKADFLDMATVFARQYNVDHTNRELNVGATNLRLTAQKAAQQAKRSKIIRDNSYTERWVDRCEGDGLRPLRLETTRQQNVFRRLMCNSGSIPTTVATLLHKASRITGTHTWPVRWTSCGTSQHYHSFAEAEKPVDTAVEPTPSFPPEWMAPTKRAKHAVARAEEGQLVWEDDAVVVPQIKEPFRPVPLAIRRLVSSQLQQQLETPEIVLSRHDKRRNPLAEIASKLAVDGAPDDCVCTVSPATSPPQPWEPQDLMDPESNDTSHPQGRCLHMQALETTLGRHTEGIMDAVLHLVLNSLQGYATAVRAHSFEQGATDLLERLHGPDTTQHNALANFRRRLRNHLHHVIGKFDPERTDGVFTWEHVLALLQQHYQHTADGHSEAVEVHPLLHPLQVSAETLQRIQNRVTLLCGNPAARHSNFDKVHPAATTNREVDQMLQGVEAEHHFDCLSSKPVGRHTSSGAEHDAHSEEEIGQEILVELSS